MGSLRIAAVLVAVLSGCATPREPWACTDAIDGSSWCFCALADDAELQGRLRDDEGDAIAVEVDACPAGAFAPDTKCCQDDGDDPFCYCTAVACTRGGTPEQPLCRCGAYDERLNPDPIVAECSPEPGGLCCVGEVGCICSKNACAQGEEQVERCTVELDRCNEVEQRKVEECAPP